jgi:hypothetical protein
LLEDPIPRVVASAGVAQPEDLRGIGIMKATATTPKPEKAVARKLAGIVAKPQIQVAMIANRIVDAVRDELAIGPTRVVMIERLEGLIAVNPTLPKHCP